MMADRANPTHLATQPTGYRRAVAACDLLSLRGRRWTWVLHKVSCAACLSSPRLRELRGEESPLRAAREVPHG
jgi:hypothetical protein